MPRFWSPRQGRASSGSSGSPINSQHLSKLRFWENGLTQGRKGARVKRLCYSYGVLAPLRLCVKLLLCDEKSPEKSPRSRQSDEKRACEVDLKTSRKMTARYLDPRGPRAYHLPHAATRSRRVLRSTNRSVPRETRNCRFMSSL